jgi:hypothetical protein
LGISSSQTGLSNIKIAAIREMLEQTSPEFRSSVTQMETVVGFTAQKPGRQFNRKAIYNAPVTNCASHRVRISNL